MTATRRDLARALEGVDGWLGLREAWALHRAARDARGPAPVAVEIGSMRGRSALAMGLAFRERGAGTLIAVDPHTRHDSFGEFQRNTAPVREHVRPVLELSPAARGHVDEPIDLLFVDGSHEYEDVKADIDAWTPLLRPGGTIAFHDAQHGPVGRVLREQVMRRGPWRRPRLVQRTLLATYAPGSDWTRRDAARARAARSHLAAATVANRVRLRLQRRPP